jgi:hypothetical protein
MFITKNLVQHSETKHIEIRFHFIRDSFEKKLIHLVQVSSEEQLADLFTKGFDTTRFNYLVQAIGLLNLN